MAETLFALTAKTLQGLEPILADELQKLGATDIHPGRRVVSFNGDLGLMYRANMQLRTALRVLRPIHQFQAYDEVSLYKGIQQIDWSRYMGVHQTLAVDSVVRSPIFRHSHYVALKGKDAIVDQFRQKTGRRPSVDVQGPDLRVHLHIDRDHVDVALDSSGNSLHKRGYRTGGHPAPLNEVLAAGLVLLSGWQADQPFVDPMCGSGSIPIEAAWIGMNRAPGLSRAHFGFMAWPDFDADLWRTIYDEANEAQRPLPAPMLAADYDERAVELTRRHLQAVGLKGVVEVRKRDFADLIPPEGSGVMIMNPPYDERMELEDGAAFYKAIGDRFKAAYKGYSAWIISGHTEALKRVGLKPDFKMQLHNGPIRCKYHRYDVY